MSKSVEKSGKTVDAAVFSALEELQTTIDEVIVEVLDEGDSGILGFGRRPARVLVTLDEPDERLVRDARPDEKDEVQYDYGTDARSRRDRDDPGMLSRENPETISDPQTGYEKDAAYYGDEGDYLNLEADTEELRESIRSYLQTVLDALHIEADIQMDVHADTLYVDIDGDDVGALIGRRGDTLHALQYLLSLSMNRQHDSERRIVLDVSSYRKRREKTLEDLALRTARKVLKVGKEYVMEDMPASERRIIHATLQDYDGVKTVSEGEEPHRYVVLVPLKKRSARVPRDEMDAPLDDED